VVGFDFTGQKLEQGGLAGPVAAHQADPVAGVNLEVCILQQGQTAKGDIYVSDAEHF
jgi:hypothetical protein